MNPLFCFSQITLYIPDEYAPSNPNAFLPGAPSKAINISSNLHTTSSEVGFKNVEPSDNKSPTLR